MIMHTRDLNGHNNSQPPQVGQLPDSFSIGNAFDPSTIEAMANELYGVVPGRSSAANQANQAQSIVEVPIPIPQPTIPGTSSIPQPEAGREIPTPNVPGVPKGESTAESNSLTAIAEQLYAQMSSASLDPAMQQAFAGLDSATFFPDAVSQFPGTPASSATLSVEALNAMVQQLSTQLSPIFLKESPVQPTPTFPSSPAELPKAATDIAAVETPSQKSETRGEAAQPSFYFLSPPAVETVGLELGEPFDVEVIRHDFPILHQKVNGKPLIWLDNAATTQKPQSVIDTLSRFYERDNSNIHRGAHTLAARATDAYEAARETVQRFLGAGSASEIIFARGTTEAINLVAQTYGRKYIRSGDEIVLSTLEHHANIVPWQMLAQETGAILKVIPVGESGELLLEEYAGLLGPRTRIVAVTHVSNALGTILPVREITEMAHRHGARVLIDGAQGVPHLPVNVQALDCDFYTFSGHKLFAPTGIGVLYGKREVLEDMPPWQGGGSMIRSVTFEHTTYEEPPAKFEAGTPSIADAVGLGAAIDYLNRIGLPNIEQYERKLTCYAIERLAQIPGLRLIGTTSHKVGVLSFILDDLPPEEVGKRLDQEGIAVRAGHHCAQPTMQRYGLTGTVRPSLTFYNTCSEIDTLVEVLRSMRFR